MKEVYFATTNKWKVEIAKQVIEKQYGVTIKPKNLGVTELQYDDPTVIAQASAKEAYQTLGAPVLKCDSGLKIPALNGFPGPYSNYVQRTLGVDGLVQVCAALEDRSAVIYSVVAFCDEHLQPVSFYGEMPGTLLKQKRGEQGYFFDFIFVPAGYDQTLAEFDDTERWKFWRGAYENFAKWYTSIMEK